MRTQRILDRVAIIAASGFALVGCGVDREANTPSFAARSVEFPGAAGSGQPRLTADVDGTPVLSWLEPAGGGSAAPHEVASGEDFFVNWADLPSVQPITPEVWVAHWLRLAPESAGAYHI